MVARVAGLTVVMRVGETAILAVAEATAEEARVAARVAHAREVGSAVVVTA